MMFYFAEGRSLVALFLFPYHHPSVDSVDSSPLWETYLPPLRRGGTQCRSSGCYSTSFFTFQHVKGKPIWLALFINLLHLCQLYYPLFFVCDRRRNQNLTLFLSSLYCFQFRHFRLLHRLRKPYTFHLF